MQNETAGTQSKSTPPGPDTRWQKPWEVFKRLDEDKGLHCSLEEILKSREDRAERQSRLAKEYGLPLVSLTLNVPGAVKQYPLARRSFDEAKRLVFNQLRRARAKVAAEDEIHERTGSELILAVDHDTLALKRLMVAIEEGNTLGRLFDIDVLLPSGEKVSREDIGLPGRSCILCGAPGKACARSHAHGLSAIILAAIERMRGYFDGQFAGKVASFAVRSLLYEICTTPKPGLVDRNNTGSHDDMDMFTFVESASVLTPYFRKCVLFGIQSCLESPESTLPYLRYVGMDAEEAMFSVTQGINTHKGAIFLLGILCASAGRAYALGETMDPERLCSISAGISAPLRKECEELAKGKGTTHGEKLLSRGIGGARGEAIGGFRSARIIGLPVLDERLAAGDSAERAGVIAILHLMANVLDTNAITRTGIEEQERQRARLRDMLEKTPLPDTEAILALDEEYIKKRCSPGGCADLLALSWMLRLLREKTTPSLLL